MGKVGERYNLMVQVNRVLPPWNRCSSRSAGSWFKHGDAGREGEGAKAGRGGELWRIQRCCFLKYRPLKTLTDFECGSSDTKVEAPRSGAAPLIFTHGWSATDNASICSSEIYKLNTCKKLDR